MMFRNAKKANRWLDGEGLGNMKAIFIDYSTGTVFIGDDDDKPGIDDKPFRKWWEISTKELDTQVELTEMRLLQDTFLDQPSVIEYARKHGDNKPLFGEGSPTIGRTRYLLRPNGQHRFEQFI